MEKKKKISITLDPALYESLILYCSEKRKSKSKIIEEALENFLDSNTDKLSYQIKNVLETQIKKHDDRTSRIQAKTAKVAYSNQYLLLKMLAYICNSEEDLQYLLQTREDAEKQAYLTLKNGYLERDVETLFSNKELIDNFNQKQG